MLRSICSFADLGSVMSEVDITLPRSAKLHIDLNISIYLLYHIPYEFKAFWSFDNIDLNKTEDKFLCSMLPKLRLTR